MTKHLLPLISVLGFFIFNLRAEPLDWSFSPLKLGRVDTVTSAWGIERTLGATRAASEFVMPIQLVYSSKEEASGLLGPQWRSPQLESRLIPVDEGILEWKTPWGASIGLNENRDNRRFSDFTREWSAVHHGNFRFTISRKDGWQFVYDKGYLREVGAPGGRKLIYRYQGKNILLAIVQIGAQGGTEWPLIQVASDSATGLARLIQIAGVESKFTFAQATAETPRRLASWSQGGATAETFSYGSAGELRSVTSPSGRKEVFETDFEKWPLDGKGGVLQVAHTKARDAGGFSDLPKVSRSVLVSDDRFQYVYTAGSDPKHPLAGKGVSVKDKLGRSQNINFARQRGVLTLTDALGNRTLVKYYRQLGLAYDYKVRQVKDPQGRVLVENKYNKEGSLVWSRDSLGNATEYTLDRNGRVTRVKRSMGKSASETVGTFVYDQGGRLVKAMNALGQATELRYNEVGDLIGFTDPEGRKHEMNYDARGFLTACTDAAGRTQKLEYDAFGRPVRTISADGIASEWILDDRGLMTSVKQRLPGESREKALTVMQRTFDADGRLLTVTDALGRTSKNIFDEQGNLAATIDPAGVATRYQRDEVGRLARFWMEKAGGAQAAGSKGAGARSSPVASDDSSDASVVRRGKIDFVLDPLDRIIEQTNALGQETAWTYDKEGRLTEKQAGSQGVRYTHDRWGRPTAVDYGDGNILKYEYGADGRIAAVSTPSSSARYEFDKLGRVTEIKMARGKETALMQYGYTPAGGKASVAWVRNDGTTRKMGRTEYRYNSVGQLQEILSDGKTVARYGYNDRGLLSEKSLADGARMIYGHDELGRIISMKTISEKGRALTEIRYTWDTANQLTSRTWDGVKQSYSHSHPII